MFMVTKLVTSIGYVHVQVTKFVTVTLFMFVWILVTLPRCGNVNLVDFQVMISLEFTSRETRTGNQEGFPTLGGAGNRDKSVRDNTRARSHKTEITSVVTRRVGLSPFVHYWECSPLAWDKDTRAYRYTPMHVPKKTWNPSLNGRQFRVAETCRWNRFSNTRRGFYHTTQIHLPI